MPSTQGKILIIDDADDIRELVSTILTRNGFKATAVISADDAGATLRDFDFDLILVDGAMTPKSGYTFIKEQQAAGLLTPIILITAHDDAYNKVRLKGTGVPILHKPFQPEELVAKIKEALESPLACR